MGQIFLNILFGGAAIVAILDYFGVNPKRISQGAFMPLDKRVKLVIMLGLVAASIGLSGYSFYRSLHPKTIEKIVEKPVEKIVTKECPKNPVQPPPKASYVAPKKPKATTPSPAQSAAGNNNGQVGGGVSTGPCSNVQLGGSGNQATTNCLPPQRELTAEQLKKFKDALSPYCPFSVAVRGFEGNEESMRYADQLKAAIVSAGCNLARPIWLRDEQAAYGVFVGVKDSSNVPKGLTR